MDALAQSAQCAHYVVLLLSPTYPYEVCKVHRLYLCVSVCWHWYVRDERVFSNNTWIIQESIDINTQPTILAINFLYSRVRCVNYVFARDYFHLFWSVVHRVAAVAVERNWIRHKSGDTCSVMVCGVDWRLWLWFQTYLNHTLSEFSVLRPTIKTIFNPSIQYHRLSSLSTEASDHHHRLNAMKSTPCLCLHSTSIHNIRHFNQTNSFYFA